VLKFFERGYSCDILLEPPIHTQDIENLQKLFCKNYRSWHVEFGRIYSIDAEMVELLYKEIIQNKKHINITTHKYKLNRYLHQLGFKAIFESLIKNDIVNIDNIEIVLIGGSADSSPKILEIIKQTNLKNLALVVVQHVEPQGKQLFDKILQQYTDSKVLYAKDGKKINKGIVYLAPHNKHLKVKNGYFVLSDEEKYNFSKPSISISYESFSAFYKEKLMVIQECGYACDGVDKLKFLRANDTKIIIQDESECEAKSMVINARADGVYDYILKLDDIISYIDFLDKQLSDDGWVNYLLDMILKKYGYDFRLYQREMIKRRIDAFMIKHTIKSLKTTVGIILFNKSAFKGFFLEVSINVTEFFRKPTSLKNIIKFLENSYKKSHNIKIWSAGCSSGEEVYSMAILLENMSLLDKSIIYATDFNSVILQEAKNGIYSNDAYKVAQENFAKVEIDANLDDHVVKNDNFIVIDETIRNKTLFLQHNLATDSSFNEFDIIICKNVIIYFDYDLQQRVFQLFYDSLKFGGHLVLGESESLHQLFRDKFEPCRDSCKIFKKVA